MHRMFLHELGPIRDCSFEINQFTVLMGPQAEGKSTVAKAVFFFRTVKDDILDMMLRKPEEDERRERWRIRLTKRLKDKFVQMFGSTHGMPNEMEARYEYSDKISIRVYLRPNTEKGRGPNYVRIDFSRDLEDYLDGLDMRVFEPMGPEQKEREAAKLAELFSDRYETIFIPAGRSMITVLTSQLLYIFTIMSEGQKRSIDYCTQRYVERILQLQPSFTTGLNGLLSDKLHLTHKKFDRQLVEKVKALTEEILKGRYRYDDGEEKLFIGENRARAARYVKINYASSGQQETVWITNILFYYLLEARPVFLILEEPESHLYPNAQKQIAELLALFRSGGNSELITTHSPYVLGEFNNLLYASVLRARGVKGVEGLIDPAKLIPTDAVSAYHVQDRGLSNAKDDDMGLILNELIDDASLDITEESDRLYELSAQEG